MAEQLAVEVDVKNVTEQQQQYTAAAVHRTSSFILFGFVVLNEKWLLGNSPYLEDILHTPEVPDGNHDGWDKIH